jgi:peptidoglycan/LPS O-acetylase OafA/YrhL
MFVTVALTGAFILLLAANFFFIDKIGKYSFYLNADTLLDLGAFFIGGSMLALINIQNIKHTNWLVISAIVILVIGLYCNALLYVKFICLPIIIIVFGLKSTPYINNIGHKIGDLSYGIYIFGFPVQQTLLHYFKLNYMQLMFYSLLITFILAYFSWHFVEKRALRLKKFKPGFSLSAS